MGDGDSNPFSIERCRELLGTEDSGLSDEEIEAIRDQTGASVHVLNTSILINKGKDELTRSLEMNAVRSPFGSENESRWK